MEGQAGVYEPANGWGGVRQRMPPAAFREEMPGEDIRLPTHMDAPHPTTDDPPPAAPTAEEVRTRRQWLWWKLKTMNPVFESPKFRVGVLSVMMLIVLFGLSYVFTAFKGANIPCERRALPGYVSECLMLELPAAIPRMPYLGIVRPTWDDMQRTVLHTYYNGAPVDIEPRTLVAEFTALSASEPARCFCGLMYGIGTSLAAIGGNVYVSPEIANRPDDLTLTRWETPASPRLEALGFRDAEIEAPVRAFYNYVTLGEEVRGKMLSGRETPCIALCLAIEARVRK